MYPLLFWLLLKLKRFQIIILLQCYRAAPKVIWSSVHMLSPMIHIHHMVQKSQIFSSVFSKRPSLWVKLGSLISYYMYIHCWVSQHHKIKVLCPRKHEERMLIVHFAYINKNLTKWFYKTPKLSHLLFADMTYAALLLMDFQIWILTLRESNNNVCDNM